jgi:hypothetical protein
VQGKTIQQNTVLLSGPTVVPIQTNHMTAGIYIINFKDQNNQTETRKMIIK